MRGQGGFCGAVEGPWPYPDFSRNKRLQLNHCLTNIGNGLGPMLDDRAGGGAGGVRYCAHRTARDDPTWNLKEL